MAVERPPLSVVVPAGVALTAGSGYALARLTGSTTCATVSPVPEDWTRSGVLPHVTGSCPLRPGALVSGLDATPGGVAARSGSGDVTLDLVPALPRLGPDLVASTPTLLFVVGLFALAVYALRRRPTDRTAGSLLILGSGLLGSTVVTFLGLGLEDVYGGWLRWLFSFATQAVYLVAWGAGLALMGLFPSPLHPALERTGPWLVVVLGPALVWAAPAVVLGALADDYVSWMRPSLVLSAGIAGLTLALSVVAVAARIVRVRRSPADLVQRQQSLWFGASAVAAGATTLAFWTIPQLFTGGPLLPVQLIGTPGLLFVAGLGVAMFRYRLFDLDTVLARTLVYSVLILGVVLTYLAATALVATLFAGLPDSRVTAVGAVAAALLVNPLRIWLARVVNRVFYGDRDTPYRALARISERLTDPRSGLAMAAEDIRTALRVPYVEIASPTRRATVSGHRLPGAEVAEFPCGPAGSSAGRLLVQTRGAGDRFASGERQLLADLARQVGVAMHEESLVADLQESRERIVTAREEERRALRRTLHDDIGPSLASLALVAETGRRLRALDPGDPRVDEILRTLGQESTGAADAVRLLAYDLRPPALDERGLVGALRDQAGSVAPLSVKVDATGMESLAGSLSAAVEAAAYRIAVGALANVRQHAEASEAVIRLLTDGPDLVVTVEDDGRGLPTDARAGVGITAMRERAEELGGTLDLGRRHGGGTRVCARLPKGAP